jgi:hypothetical protein
MMIDCSVFFTVYWYDMVCYGPCLSTPIPVVVCPSSILSWSDLRT